jgi:hypothetical protein
MFIIDPLLITILINQNQVLWRKNKNSYRPPEINKGNYPNLVSIETKGAQCSECSFIRTTSEYTTP